MISSMKFNFLTYQSSSLRKYLSIFSFSCAFNDKNSLLCHLLGNLKNLGTLNFFVRSKLDGNFRFLNLVQKRNFLRIILVILLTTNLQKKEFRNNYLLKQKRHCSSNRIERWIANEIRKETVG